MKKLNYITLFSSGGVGCYGFKNQNFDCIATVEIIKRRLEIQKINDKCKYNSGYICDDITKDSTKEILYREIDMWKSKECIKNVDVVIATPPCQGMSTANSKKNDSDLYRNSLVVESIEIIDKIKPNFFIFENVPAFMKTNCLDKERKKHVIGEFLYKKLSKDYSIYDQVVNFMEYGVPSSRKRCLVIGVKNNLSSFISPIELFPDKVKRPKTIKETIYKLDRLKIMGEISKKDIYHFYRPFDARMLDWIKKLKPGMSAFDNVNDIDKPHRISKNGDIVVNKNKMGGKYKRQTWDQVAPCVHTRNDALASQNTIHPEDNRVFSIRELMLFMSVPRHFKWSNISENKLNNLNDVEKKEFLKKNEINIRQILGEAVPTLVFESIAKKIKLLFSDKNIEKFRDSYNLEFANPNREKNEAYYTDKFLVNEISKNLPTFSEKDTIHILEPSVGLGSFLPIIFKKYESHRKIYIDVIDIDNMTIKHIKEIYSDKFIPKNVKINFIDNNFLLMNINKKYDLVVGNPPFKKMEKQEQKIFKDLYPKFKTTNAISFFLMKSISLSNYVSLVLPKNFLIAPQYNEIRNFLKKLSIKTIIDFENIGFEGVLVETINLILQNKNEINENIEIINLKTNKRIFQDKNYIMDDRIPNWVLYRNEYFDSVLSSIKTDIFYVKRDRQITNKFLTNLNSENKQIKVLRSKNIDENGNIISIPNYDRFLKNSVNIKKLSMYEYINDVEALICPNFTTNIRVTKKPKNTLVNGSIAIFKNKTNLKIKKEDLKWFSSKEFIEFYKLSNNYQKNTLNLDNNSIFYFGVKKRC